MVGTYDVTSVELELINLTLTIYSNLVAGLSSQWLSHYVVL